VKQSTVRRHSSTDGERARVAGFEDVMTTADIQHERTSWPTARRRTRPGIFFAISPMPDG
jgi:hypothetical protein